MDRASVEAFRANFSAAESEHRHLQRCWSHQHCRDCLAARECGWCPLTWACVPDSHAIPLLAPALDGRVCPHPDEQWELRTNPFGCHVSSITSLTALVAGLAGLLLASWTALSIVALCRWRRASAQKPDWDQRCIYPWRASWGPPTLREQQPLLDEQPER